MKITKERYEELGLSLCKDDCEDCLNCYNDYNGNLCCDELEKTIDKAIEEGLECPELDKDWLRERMTEEEYDAWRHNRLEVED